MKIYHLLFALLFIHVVAYGQVLQEKEIIKPTEKGMDVFGKYFIKSAVSGSGQGEISNNMVASIEITPLKDNSIVIRHEYTFTKYDANLNKQWETKIKPFMGLQNAPANVSLGDKNGFFFIEEKGNNGTDFFITKFDNAGQTIQQRYMPAEKNSQNVAYFVSDLGLHIVNLQILKKPAQYTYRLLTFSGKDLSVKETILKLSTDDYELAETSTVFPRFMCWNGLKVVNDKMILFKSYKKEKKDLNVDKYIVKTIELSTTGEVSNLKDFSIEGTAKYRLPSLQITEDGKQLYVFGYTSIKSELTTDGLYINKFDYIEGKPVFKKELSFSSIAPGVSIEDRNFSFYKVYPVLNMVEGVYEFANNNEELNFILFKSQKTTLSNTSVYSVNVDREGTVTSVYENVYNINPIVSKRHIRLFEERRLYVNYIHNGGFFPAPIISKKLYSKGQPAVITPLQFVYENAHEKATNDILWNVVPLKDANLLFEVNDLTNSIKMIKLKK